MTSNTHEMTYTEGAEGRRSIAIDFENAPSRWPRFPENHQVCAWDYQRVGSWLDAVGLSKYKQEFVEEGVDGKLLVYLVDPADAAEYVEAAHVDQLVAAVLALLGKVCANHSQTSSMKY